MSVDKIYNELLMKVDTDLDINDVILSKENRDKIEEFLIETKYADKFIEKNLRPMNRLLFYGASGTGKTYLSKALSNHLKYKMFYIDIATSISQGNAAINISNVFSIANEEKHCLIMLDECDSIAWNRDSVGSDSGDIRRATNSLFQQLDQMEYSNIFIAATNLLHRIDPAFERRFDMKLEFRRPELNLKDTISKFLHEDFKLIDDVDNTTRSIVERRNILSHYEVKGIVERAMKKAIVRNKSEVSTLEIYKDMAIAMRIKINLGTDKDSEDTFRSSIK